MIEITKYEAKQLRSQNPRIKITKTRHKLYVEELKSILEMLPNNLEAVESLKNINSKYNYNNDFNFEV